MMRITTDPSRDLSFLQGDVNRVFERFFGPQGAAAQQQHQQPWIPPLDIVEHEDRFVLHVDLPGMTAQDVEVELEDRVLRICGERRDDRERTGEGFRRIERSFGRFERVLTLPRGVDAEGVRASFDNGVLELSVPKPEERRPRRIDVQSGSSRTDEIEGRETAESREAQESQERELAHA